MKKLPVIIPLIAIVFLVFINLFKQNYKNNPINISPTKYPLKVIVADSDPNSPRWIINQAIKDNNIGESNNLDIEWKNVPASEGPAALLSDRVNISNFNPVNAVRANANTEDRSNWVMIFDRSYYMNTVLVTLTNSSYNNIEDLKGKRISTLPVTTMDYTVFKVIIEKLGYNLEKDFIVSSLPVAALNVVLDKKESKAILTSDSLIIKPLVEKKYQRIADLNDMWKNEVSNLIPYTGLAAKDSWLRDHKDEAIMFSKTWYDAALFLKNHPEYFEKKEIVDALQLETQEEINEYRNITYSILPTEPWTENDITMSRDFLNEIKNQAEFPDGFSTDIFTLLK